MSGEHCINKEFKQILLGVSLTVGQEAPRWSSWFVGGSCWPLQLCLGPSVEVRQLWYKIGATKGGGGGGGLEGCGGEAFGWGSAQPAGT